MSILSITNNHINLRKIIDFNTIESSGYYSSEVKREFKEIMEKYHKELFSLQVNNKEPLSIDIIKEIAPNWTLLKDIQLLIDLGLEEENQKDFALLTNKAVDYDDLTESEKKWFVEFVNNLNMNIKEQIHHEFSLKNLKFFYELNDELLKSSNKVLYALLLNQYYLKLNTNEEIQKFVTLFNFVKEAMCNTNHSSVINLLTTDLSCELIYDLAKEVKDKKIEEVSYELFAFYREFVKRFEINNIEKEVLDKNIYDKLLALEKYNVNTVIRDEKTYDLFIPFFKEGKTLNAINQSLLAVLELFTYSEDVKFLIENIKKKKFIQNILELKKEDKLKMLRFHDSYGFEHFDYIIKYVNLNTLTKEDILLITSDSFEPSYMRFVINLMDKRDGGLLDKNELFTYYHSYIRNRKTSSLIEFVIKNFKDMKIDERLTLFKLLDGVDLSTRLSENQTVIEQGLMKKLNTLNKPINLIHFYQGYEDKFNRETAFLYEVLLFTGMKDAIELAETNQDVWFIYKNYKKLKFDRPLEEIKKDFIENSSDIDEYLKTLNISKDFVLSNIGGFMNFIENGNYETSKMYMKTLSNKSHKNQVKNLGLIVKAEIAGKLENIKYNRDDLRQEIGFKISNEQIDLWKKEIVYNKRFKVRESSDFKTLFEMGEHPTVSCMSYRTGSYNECLLSIFDGNKKLVTVYDNDKLVGRAILRLTKINETGEVNDSEKFGFRDIENESQNGQIQTNDEVILFLERFYTSYTGEQRREMEKIMFDLLKEKSNEMNIPIYVSSDYYIVEDGTKTEKVETRMFVSHSKNGKQYLDSLGGSASSSVGGTFKVAKVYKLLF